MVIGLNNHVDDDLQLMLTLAEFAKARPGMPTLERAANHAEATAKNIAGQGFVPDWTNGSIHWTPHSMNQGVLTSPRHCLDYATVPHQRVERYRSLGQRLLKEGRVAVLMLAGGESTRMGEFRGAISFNTVAGPRTVFNIQLSKVAAQQVLFRAPLPLHILTSKGVADVTREAIAHSLPPELTCGPGDFTIQPSLPVLSPLLKTLWNDDGQSRRRRESPTGHGGLFDVMDQVLNRLPNVDHIFCFIYPNIAENICDPVMLGYHAENGFDITTKSIPATALDANEKKRTGRVMEIDGQVRIIEYHALRSEQQLQLTANAPGSTATHVFRRDFLEQCVGNGIQLPYYLLLRNNPQWSDEAREEPKKIWKGERFIFDLFESAKSVGVVIVDKNEEYWPLKQTGDRVQVQAALDRLYPQWLAQGTILR